MLNAAEIVRAEEEEVVAGRRDPRGAARDMAGRRADTAVCADLWTRLVRRELRVVLSVTEESHEYLVLGDAQRSGPPWSGRQLEIVERVLQGGSRKVVAIDLGVSPSTIAVVLSSALRELGLGCRPTQTPPLILGLARAARGDGVADDVSVDEVEYLGRRHYRVARNVNSHFFTELTPAQCAVVRHLVCGRTYAEIAACRYTSTRTVANQVAAAFRRLGVSGRVELAQLVVSERRATGSRARCGGEQPARWSQGT